MVSKKFIAKIESTESFYDFYKLKPLIIKALQGEPIDSDRLAELNSKSMKELRAIGKPLGAMDTSKKELILEIVKAQEKVEKN